MSNTDNGTTFLDDGDKHDNSEVVSKKQKMDSQMTQTDCKTDPELSFPSNLDDSFTYATASMHPVAQPTVDTDKDESAISSSTVLLEDTSAPNSQLLNSLQLSRVPTQCQTMSNVHGYINNSDKSNSILPTTSLSYIDENNNIKTNCEVSNTHSEMAMYDANEQQAAEDIVRKLCKNGKLMEFQEGEDFIKVIVYEDSQEEDVDSQSVDEEESMVSVSQHRAQTGPSRNLLDCLTESGKEIKKR